LHKIAQYICLTARCGSIIGEMVVSNCARRPAGRIFMSRAIRDAGIRAVRRDQRYSHASSTDGVVLSASADILNLMAADYQTKLLHLAKTNPPGRTAVAGPPRAAVCP